VHCSPHPALPERHTLTTEVRPPDRTGNSPSVGKVHELGHLVLYLHNIERALTFYRDLLGWPVRPMPGYPE